jgi:hypothetical protein
MLTDKMYAPPKLMESRYVACDEAYDKGTHYDVIIVEVRPQATNINILSLFEFFKGLRT